MQADTLGGEKLTVSSKDGAVSFTVGATVANVTTADVEASNGVIHVIDAVILPMSNLPVIPLPPADQKSSTSLR